MKRNTYGAKLKAAIIAAVSDVRADGGTWKKAYEAAKKAGYKGSLQGIAHLMRAAGAKKAAGKRRGRKPWPKPWAVAKRGPGRPPKVAAASGSASIEALVNKVVQERVKEILAPAIAIIQQAKGE